MKTLISKTGIGLIIVGMFLIAVAFFTFGSKIVFGNTSSLVRGCQTASATTTLSFITAGTATTTLACDMANGTNLIADSATLNFQVTASSTSAIPKVEYEYAESSGDINCVTNQTACDWYQNNLASTTDAYDATITGNISWTFASSSVGGQPNLTQRINKIFNVRVPARYVRAVMTSRGANIGVWAEFVAKKQNQ